MVTYTGRPNNPPVSDRQEVVQPSTKCLIVHFPFYNIHNYYRMDSPPPLPMFCINLDKRADRWQEFQDTWSASYPQIQRFSGIVGPTGVDGCRESHFAVIRAVKEAGYPWVCIMEDDCIPYEHFQEEFPKALAKLWKHRDKWSIFNGGPIALQSITRVDGQLLHIDTWACTQCIIINASAYNTILNDYSNEKPGAVDMYYKLYPTMCWTPPLTYQRDSPSDIQAGYTIGAMPDFPNTYRKLMIFAPQK